MVQKYGVVGFAYSDLCFSVISLSLLFTCSEMAEANISVSKDEFNCPVCLSLLNDPVTIPCGHSYCMSCISKYWNQDDQKGVHSCPECRKTFTQRPVLNKNTFIAGMVEKVRKSGEAIPAHCHAGPGDVECDNVSNGKKHKAINLACRWSDGQNNLEQHEEFNSGKRHKTDGTTQLQQMICPQHGQILDIHCTDQQGVCHLCKLKETQRKYQQKIQMRQKQIQELRACVESHKRSAQTAVEDCEIMFTELISSIEKSRSEVTQLIRDQENAAVSQTERLLDELEQEIDDLRRKDAELEQLSNTNDDINFLQKSQLLSAPPETPDSSSITVMSLSFDDIGKSVSHLRDKLERFCREELENINLFDRVKYTEITLCPEPKTRKEFIPYCHPLTLDPNTVNERLQLSRENRAVTYSSNVCHYPDHPDRFHPLLQVLCREMVRERCYWEVELSGKVGISVSYESISRKGRGDECEFGLNDQSWSLICSDSSYSFCHNNIKTKLPIVSRCCKVGVYVDHSGGTLSFYNVSDSMTLIHSVQTAFTQPLYPGFRLYLKSNVTLCDQTLM